MIEYLSYLKYVDIGISMYFDIIIILIGIIFIMPAMIFWGVILRSWIFLKTISNKYFNWIWSVDYWTIPYDRRVTLTGKKNSNEVFAIEGGGKHITRLELKDIRAYDLNTLLIKRIKENIFLILTSKDETSRRMGYLIL